MTKPIRKITGVSVNRSDFGRMRVVYEHLQAREDVELEVIATGSHFCDSYGRSIDEIRASGFDVIEMPVSTCSPAQTSAQILDHLSTFLAKRCPDIFLILGDRHEMLACAQAAMHAGTAIAHIGGGYLTLGAIDDRIRHSITKLAQLHFVANEDCSRRVRQMGELEDHVHIVGAPDLDMVRETKQIHLYDLAEELGLDDEQPYLLATIHPETHRLDTMEEDILTFFAALNERPEQILITAPALEEGATFIMAQIEELCKSKPGTIYRQSLGQQRYVSAMKYAAALVGNSSSGIIEASFFPVAVVNVGDRQKGRVQGRNVHNASWEKVSILEAIDRATQAEFHAGASPYGDGHSAGRIVDILTTIDLPVSLNKPFDEWADS